MRPNGAFQIQHIIEATGVFGLKPQSPSMLEWRLRVEVKARLSLRKTTITLCTPLGLIGQSQLPGLVAPSRYLDTHTRPREGVLLRQTPPSFYVLDPSS
jgi:hypothetical protein